jgi:hypothetical protein
MPHPDRPLMKPLPRHTFQEIYQWVEGHDNQTVSLILPSGVTFEARAGTRRDGRVFIECTGGNCIYECCWGNYNNHMGQNGQRIGHYSAELDANHP